MVFVDAKSKKWVDDVKSKNKQLKKKPTGYENQIKKDRKKRKKERKWKDEY